MKLVVVRHGETDFNKKGILQGQEKDVPLNDTGVRQVEEMVLQLPKDIDRIMSSPLRRALQTAEIINKHVQKTIQLRDELKEISHGNLAGRTWAEIEKDVGNEGMYEKDQSLTFDYRPFGGESAEDVRRRVKVFIEDVARTYTGETILITAHGGIIKIMHALFPQKEKKETDNASIHEFTF